MGIYRTALKRPVTIVMIFLSFVVLGGISMTRLPLEFLPGIDAPFLFIYVPYIDTLPTQAEEEITKPIEEVLATLSSVVRMGSGSGPVNSYVWLEFKWGTDIDVMRVEVREKIDQIRAELPETIDQVFIFAWNTNDIPIIEGRISAHGKDLMGSYDLLEKKIINPIMRIEGVGRVQVHGVEPSQIDIYLDQDRVKDFRVDLGRLFQGLRGANLDLSVGKVNDGGKRYTVRTLGSFRTVEEIEQLPIRQDGLRLGDIARIEYHSPELDYGRFLNGEPAVAFWIQKESGHNVVEVVDRVNKELERINQDPALAGIETVTFFDQSKRILSSIDGLRSSGMWGALLAVLVLYFFLRRAVPTIIVALAIPISLISTCAILYLTGHTLNILTMMGLMLGVGMLVDNAVVVIESIFRRHNEGMNSIKAALVGTREVAVAIFAATMTSVIVFAPVIFLGGRTEFSTFLSPVGITISVALIISLLVSQTLIPLLSSRFLGRADERKAREPGRLRRRMSNLYWKAREKRFDSWTSRIPWLVRFMQNPRKVRGRNLIERETLRYLHFLEWTTQKRPLLAGFVLLPLAFAVTIVAANVSGQFNISMEEAELHERLYISYDFADNLNYRETKKYVEKVQDLLMEKQDILHFTTIYSYYEDNHAGTTLYFDDEYLTMDALREKRELVRNALPEIAGLTLEMGDDQGSGGQGQGGGNTSAIELLNLFGEDRDLLEVIGNEVARRLEELDDLEEVRPDLRQGNEEVHIVVDRDRARSYGMSPMEVAQILNFTYRGAQLPKFQGQDRETDVLLSFQPEDKTDLSDLSNLTVSLEGDRDMLLGAMASMHHQRGPSMIFRLDQKSSVRIVGTYAGDERQNLNEQVADVMAGVPLPTGYEWSFGRRIQRTSEQGNQAMVVMLLAFLSVFIVMAALFENLLYPLVIMICVPFASLGVIWLFIITSTPWTIMALIGIVILIGIVVNNGIVLVDHINNYRRAGLDRDRAILEAGRERFRPILMTAFTTVLGLIPMALGKANMGGATYYPLALAIIGGLLSSTVLTLVFLPAYYVIVDRFQGSLLELLNRAGAPLMSGRRLPWRGRAG